MIECPKCHYVRQQIDVQVNSAICPSCGIVYEKWRERQQAAKKRLPIATDNDADNDNTDEGNADQSHKELRQIFREFILYVPQNIDPGTFWVRVITLMGFAIWGVYFITAGVDWEKIGGSFLHNVNLPFHEFGHIFFMPFGRFMTILGGSLFQVLLPLALMGVFLLQQRDNFAGSIMLWWCGQNFIDIAPYIRDAEYRALPLVGGGGEESHDWGNLLTMMNALEHTYTLARISSLIGGALIIVALIWGVIILRLQKKNLAKF